MKLVSKLKLKQLSNQLFLVMIRICRKMIVDWIEAGSDADLEGWKKSSSGGSKKYPI
jgi:hypothetical protein